MDKLSLCSSKSTLWPLYFNDEQNTLFFSWGIF